MSFTGRQCFGEIAFIKQSVHNINVCARGEMDITLVFGTSVRGSSPFGRTISSLRNYRSISGDFILLGRLLTWHVHQ